MEEEEERSLINGRSMFLAEEEERVESKILRGKPTRLRVIPGRPALLGWRGEPRPQELAPLGMTQTPALRVSADLLVTLCNSVNSNKQYIVGKP